MDSKKKIAVYPYSWPPLLAAIVFKGETVKLLTLQGEAFVFTVPFFLTKQKINRWNQWQFAIVIAFFLSKKRHLYPISYISEFLTDALFAFVFGGICFIVVPFFLFSRFSAMHDGICLWNLCCSYGLMLLYWRNNKMLREFLKIQWVVRPHWVLVLGLVPIVFWTYIAVTLLPLSVALGQFQSIKYDVRSLSMISPLHPLWSLRFYWGRMFLGFCGVYGLCYAFSLLMFRQMTSWIKQQSWGPKKVHFDLWERCVNIDE